MADYATLKAAIQAVIYENGNQEITGSVMQATLLAMVNSLGANYQYAGIATPSTNPGTPDQNVFYLASTAGTYVNFGNIVLAENEVAILKYNGSWTKEVAGLASAERVNQLDQKVDGLIVNQNYEVDTNAKRQKNYTIAPGTKIVIKVIITGGTGTSYSAYWIKGSGNEAIFTGAEYGYVSDVLTVPNDATGVQIFMGGVASGNTRNVKIYDASLPAYLTETTPKLETRMGVVEGKTATLEGEVIALDQKIGGFYARQTKLVNSSGKRGTSINVPAGAKICVRVSMVSGVGTWWGFYWTSGVADNLVETDLKPGDFSKVYTVPAGVTNIYVWTAKYSDGPTYQIDVYDADSDKFAIDRLNDVDTYEFIKNNTPSVISASLAVSSAAQIILETTDTKKLHKYGDVYAFINSMTAELDPTAGITFYSAEENGPVTTINARDLWLKPVRLWSGATLGRIVVGGNAVTTAGDISIAVYALPQSVEDIALPLKGRRIVCFGDSVTEFKNESSGLRYSDILMRISGAEVLNAGIGGTRLAYRAVPSTTPADNQECVAAFEIVSLITSWASGNFSIQDAALASGYLTSDQQTLYANKLAMLKANPVSGLDIVTIFGGSNDYTGGSVIGDATASNTDKGTVYGAINSMVAALLTAKPTLKIYFFSPIIRMFQNTVSLASSSDVFVHSNAPEGKTLPEFCEVIADAVKLNHAPFCDWYWSLGWNVYNFTTFFGSDFSHPFNGFAVLAEKMCHYLCAN